MNRTHGQGLLRRRPMLPVLAGILLVAAAAVRAADVPGPIDWNRARELNQQKQQGQTLSPEDQAYLDRALAFRQSGGGAQTAALASLPPEDRQRAQEVMQKQRNGETLTDDERAFIQRIRAALGQPGGGPGAAALAALTPDERQRAQEIMQKQRAGETLTDEEKAFGQQVRAKLAAPRADAGASQAAPAAPLKPRDSVGFIPLTEMTADQKYKGENGGLYGAGRNEPPPAHLKAALAEAARIAPLDADGKPSPQGRIALLSVGMSNTTQEFSRFKEMADRDPAKAANLVIVDGAQGGQAAAQWAAAPDNRVWQTVESRLQAAGVAPAQVQVAWLKQANIRPTEPHPRHTQALERDITTSLHLLKQKFPNLRIVYLSSRIYGGYASTALNPEPYAYEGAFAVRDLILEQINGEARLNCDPARGAVKAPLLLWGPYLWADGVTPRKADGLVWRREDLREDGTHPSATSGRDKVAQMLLAFFKTDRTAAAWFVRAAGPAGKK